MTISNRLRIFEHIKACASPPSNRDISLALGLTVDRVDCATHNLCARDKAIKNVGASQGGQKPARWVVIPGASPMRFRRAKRAEPRYVPSAMPHCALAEIYGLVAGGRG